MKINTIFKTESSIRRIFVSLDWFAFNKIK